MDMISNQMKQREKDEEEEFKMYNNNNNNYDRLEFNFKIYCDDTLSKYMVKSHKMN